MYSEGQASPPTRRVAERHRGSKMNAHSKKRIERLVKMLTTMWKVRRVGNMGDDALLEWNNTVYFLCDNGGEWNVDAVNSQKTIISVPYTRFGMEIDVYTQAMRIMKHLRGDEQDYLNDNEPAEDVQMMCEIAKLPVEPDYTPYGSPMLYMEHHFA